MMSFLLGLRPRVSQVLHEHRGVRGAVERRLFESVSVSVRVSSTMLMWQGCQAVAEHDAVSGSERERERRHQAQFSGVGI